MTKSDDSAIERYTQARAYLDELAAFVRAASAELASDSPLLTGRDMGEWLGQIDAYQHITLFERPPRFQQLGSRKTMSCARAEPFLLCCWAVCPKTAKDLCA